VGRRVASQVAGVFRSKWDHHAQALHVATTAGIASRDGTSHGLFPRTGWLRGTLRLIRTKETGRNARATTYARESQRSGSAAGGYTPPIAIASPARTEHA
jgi:hypothetical protein